jgi:AcrR family transcriptional regulator
MAGAQQPRKRILEAAAEAMTSRGVERATFSEVARRSGVSKSLIHYYFNGKEDLLAEVVAALEDEVDEFWRSSIAKHDDPWQRFVASVQALNRLYQERPKFWELLLELLVASRRNPKLEAPAKRLVERLVGELKTEIEATTAQLPIASPVAAPDAASMVAALMYGLGMIKLVDGRDPTPALRAFVLTVLMAGALTYVIAGEEPPLEHIFSAVNNFDPGNGTRA